MSDFWKKLLIHTGIGLGAALLISILLGLFRAEVALDRLRILCDGFFVAAMGLLCAGGFRWTSNGGVMDGLGYATRSALPVCAGISKPPSRDSVSISRFSGARPEAPSTCCWQDWCSW